jgi:proteasome lid subunit RPN8/RPN11
MSVFARLTRAFLHWIGLDRFYYERILLTGRCAEQIINFARRAHPREFSALIEGRVRQDTLVLSSVIYQHFEASDRAAVLHMNVPIGTDIRATVHSHPSHNALPSRADLRYFNKYAYVNFIIRYPYQPQDIVCYDARGRQLSFIIRM